MGNNKSKITSKKNGQPLLSSDLNGLIADLGQLIDETRSAVAVTVNAGLTLLYWRVGARINKEILNQNRAEYGKQIIATVAQQLTEHYGKGFTYSSLTRMVKFSSVFPDQKILATLSQQLSWSHFRELLSLEKPLQREFYAEMCRVENWSVRTLRQKIDGMLYERTALSKKPDELIQQELRLLREEDRLSPDLVFRDPYFLDFLGLKDRYLEKDLEDAILRELEQFLLELGSGFAFMARQKRIQLDNDDYYIDLLFYHRGLNRLIAIDLKMGDFKAEYKGQMELYLRWLNKYERRPQEKEPLGIILCAGKKQELVELLELGQSGIHVAEYRTELPSRELLEQKLHSALVSAKDRMNILP
ncbi:MAG: PDDEXK nuclease domain-containing protein [Candidatus Electrothrix sp. GW3-4]|uniref:PDDEXK nuclease domain-containing protein n=1 Tax=Candidatus Electrothrix sp. GW3-4 TaxID=3126740 RepID=UPI0030D5A6E2